MRDKYKTGQIVYVYERWSDSIIKAVVTGINGYSSLNNDSSISICYQSIVDRNGNEIADMVGDSFRPPSEMWESAAAAYAAQDKKHEAAVAAYRNEITDIESLISFPFKHCLNGEEYTNMDAATAYKERAKELLGLDLDKEDKDEEMER